MGKQGDPFEFYGERHGNSSLDAAAIRETVTEPAKHARALTDLGTELNEDTRRIDVSVEGEITNPIQNNAAQGSSASNNLASKGHYATGLMLKFADVVQTFDTETERLNNLVQADAASATRWAGQAAAQKGEDFDSSAYFSQAFTNATASRRPEYNKAVNALDDGADEVALWFQQGPEQHAKALLLAGLIPFNMAALYGITLTPEELSRAKTAHYKALFRDMTPEEQVQFIKNEMNKPRITAPGSNTPLVDPAIIAAVSPAAQQLVATEVATAIKGKQITAETVNLMNVFSGQQPFAHGVYTQVSPNEFGDAIQHLNDEAFAREPNAHIDEEKRGLYSQFLRGAGTTLATYSQADGEYAPPLDPEHPDQTRGQVLASKWLNAITDDDNHENAAALTLLMRKGGHEAEFETDFMTSLSEGIYDWEREQDGDPVWGPRDTGIMDPDADIEINRRTEDGGAFGSDEDIYTYSRGHATDGLANILGAMENSPDAAQNFFMDNDGNVDKSKMDYLMGTWDGDDVSARTFSNDRNSDEGDGFGLALEAATTGNRAHELIPGQDIHHDEFAASLTSDLFHRITEFSGKGDQWGWGDGRWHTWPDMRDSLGSIAGCYINDIYDISQHDGRSFEDGMFHPGRDGLPAGLMISKADLATVIGEIGLGDDKTGLETLTTSAVNYNNQLTSDYLANHRDALQAQYPNLSDAEIRQKLTIAELDSSGMLRTLEDQGAVTGNTLDFILGSGIEGGKEGEDFEKKRAEMISKAFSVVSGLVPSPPGHVAGWLTDTGMSLIEDQLGATPDSSPSEEANKAMTSDMKTKIEYGTYNALVRNGYLDPSVDPRYGIPQSALIPDGHGGVMIDPALYNGEPGDVDRPGSQPGLTAEEEYNRWKEGPDPTTQAESEYNGPPSDIFSEYLEAYAGAAYGEGDN